jgi:predicted dehydrogenase
MKKVRFGVIGVGGMGSGHARWCSKDGGKDLCLTAVCDIVEDKARRMAEEVGVPYFTSGTELMDSGLVDAVVIATPHYWHPPLAIHAARRGLHVLCEKPIASAIGKARAMVEECRKNKVAFGVVLHHRTRAVMRKMKQLVDSGAVGELFRVELICSNWFRTQAYYDSGAWRGTWDGEGGGVLINQAPHSLDLFQWIGGMPKRVVGFTHTRAHKIEVEDTANFLCDYGGGKVGYLYGTTAEQPGKDQFTLCGDKGTLVFAEDKLRWAKLKVPVSKFIMGCKKAWPGPNDQKVTWSDVKLPAAAGGTHLMIIKAFAAHILRGTDLYCTGKEALNELELSNAMYIAGYKNRAVDLPVDAAEMDRLLAQLEKERSTGRGEGIRKASDAEFAKLMRARK